MAKLLITPDPSKLPQVRQFLDNTYAQKVWGYTIHENGSVTVHGTLPGTLHDIARDLEEKGLATASR